MKKKLITTIFSALLALALFCAAQAAVDRAGAQALALKAAGVAEADVRRLSVETETRGGRTVYDVEFRFGGFEYEYWISRGRRDCEGFVGAGSRKDAGNGARAGQRRD